MNKKVGVAVFIMVILLACYFIQQGADLYRANRQTYGEYKANGKQNETTKAVIANTKQVEIENLIAEDNKQEIKKVAYLTFDDGPSENTEKVLQTLKKYNIKATFFMIGNEITKEREPLVKQMVEEGHLIGIHTYSHEKNEIYCSKDACILDFQKAYDRIYEVTGIAPTVYRFPWGSANCYIKGYCNEVIKEMDQKGLTFYDWNVTAEDSVGRPTSYSILKNISGFKKYNEPVILMHDGQSNKLTVKMLPEIIEKIKAAGYEFDTVDHRTRPYQWKHDWK